MEREGPQNDLKVIFLTFYRESVRGIFLIFYDEVEQSNVLKFTQMIILGKILFLRFWTKRGPKWVRNEAF